MGPPGERTGMTGTSVAGYQIIEKLGRGGMGVVYKARDLSLDRIVAMKALTAEMAKNPELEQRFRAEAKAQASLNHVNLATLYAFLVEKGTAWMVMEFIEGETFAAMIQRRGRIPADEAVPMFRQALLGLGYAHSMGIVHRDIKPGNMMLNRQGIVKVMDFGIAKMAGERSLTRTGMAIGTAWYMAPEQVMHKGADARSDIYQLGITLYEMLCGRVPFQSDSEYQVMSDHVRTPPPPPTQFSPGIPPGVVGAILKALAKDPDARFQTCEEFSAALESADLRPAVPVVAAPVPAPFPPPIAVPPPAPARPAGFWTVPRLVLLGLLALAVTTAAAWMTLQWQLRSRKTPHIVKIVHPATPTPVSLAQNNTPPPTPALQPATPPPEAPPEENNNVPAEPPPAPRRRTQAQAPSSPPPQQQAQPQPPLQSQAQPEQSAPQPAAPAPAPGPVIPAGTVVEVRTTSLIDSGKSRPGQKYAASVAAPVVVNGNPVVPRGAMAQLQVVEASDSGHFTGRAVLELRLVALEVNGHPRNVVSDLVTRQGSLRAGASATIVGGAAAVGGVLGGVFGHRKKKDAAEGAGAGAAAGAGAEELTRGAVQIPSESRLVFQLRAPAQ